MTDISIRKTTVADIPAVAAILQEGKTSIAELGITQWQNGPYPGRIDVEADVAAGISYLAEDTTGTALGTIAVTTDGDAAYDHIDGAWLTSSTSEAPRYATVHRTAVLRAAARRGVMSALMTAAEDIARDAGCESVRVDTHPGNTPMRSLLNRCGFTLCGTITLLKDEPDPTRVAYEKLV